MSKPTIPAGPVAAQGSKAAAAMFGPKPTQTTPAPVTPPSVEATAADTAAPAAVESPTDLIPRAESIKAFAARDKAKSEAKRANTLLRAVATKFGIAPEELQIAESGEVMAVTGGSLDKAVQLLDTGGDANRRNAALETWIREMSGDAPIREALAAERATHDGSGNYDDLLQLIRPSIKQEIAIDEETGKASVSLTVIDDKGMPVVKPSGTGLSVREFVAAWLEKRPHFKQSSFRPGPGAGSRSVGAPGGASALTPAERGKALGAKMFGPAVAARNSPMTAGERLFGKRS